MAKPDFPLNIDRRRRLLASVVALPAASIVPGVKAAGAAVAAPIRSFAMVLDAEAANVCAVTATRIAEIGRRNDLRSEHDLPLLSIAKELRRMKTAADTEKVERFRMALRQPVFQKCSLGRGGNAGTRLGHQKVFANAGSSAAKWKFD